jgi:hypothetical protein
MRDEALLKEEQTRKSVALQRRKSMVMTRDLLERKLSSVNALKIYPIENS